MVKIFLFFWILVVDSCAFGRKKLTTKAQRHEEFLDSVPSKADVNKLDNPAWPKANHQARTELCV